MDGTLLGAVICSLFLAVNCVYTASDDVVTLTPSNFNKEVIQSDSLWLVEFYAPWCGHCKALTPEWKKAATALTGIVKLGAVDCDQHKSLGSQYSVRGYPTIKVFGANKNKPEEYSGGRTSESIVDSAINALRAMAKDRLSGRGGGSESGKQQGIKPKPSFQRQQPQGSCNRQYPQRHQKQANQRQPGHYRPQQEPQPGQYLPPHAYQPGQQLPHRQQQPRPPHPGQYRPQQPPEQEHCEQADR